MPNGRFIIKTRSEHLLRLVKEQGGSGMRSGVKVRGFIRGQIVDNKTKKIVGDTGWVKNMVTNDGLTDLALLIAGGGGYAAGYLAIGSQTAAMNATQTDITGRGNSFQAISTSTTGTATMQATASFNGANGSLNVGAAGLFKTNSAGSMIAGQIFTSSALATNQTFNLTYQLRFATA